MLRRLANDHSGEVRRPDRRIATANHQIAQRDSPPPSMPESAHRPSRDRAVRDRQPQRRKILSGVASIDGSAPIEASCGDTVRHRPSRTDDRQLNHARRSLQLTAIAQIARPTPRAVDHKRKRADSKATGKRSAVSTGAQSDVVDRRLLADAIPVENGPETTLGGPPAKS
jgi:hypothetical protein